MVTLGERGFHVLLGTLFLSAAIFETLAERHLAAWNPPTIGVLTLAVGLAWVARYAAWRAELMTERERVQDDRLERLERKIAALETELDSRRRAL
ncbi:MAG: hypothetical protein IT457_21645 [Planctomycetes bacterium]|nr:hypothetical protein [Planctomycetota bacterium]